MGTSSNFSVHWALIELSAGEFDQIRFNRLVEISYNIAIQYVFGMRKWYPLFGSLNDETMEDLAVESITNLFIKNSEGAYHISEALKNWKPAVESEDTALYFLNKLIGNRVNQQVQNYLRFIDPLYGKLIDGLNYRIKKCGYRKIVYFGVTYIAEHADYEIEATPTTYEEFISYADRFINASAFDFEAAFAYEREKHKGKAAVLPFHAIIYTMKQYYTDMEFTSIGHNTGLESILIDEYVEAGYREVIAKLRDHYLQLHKINSEESDAIALLFESIAKEFKNGGIGRGMYHYAEQVFPGISKKVYKSQYEDIVEYLLKLFKTKIAEEILKN